MRYAASPRRLRRTAGHSNGPRRRPHVTTEACD